MIATAITTNLPKIQFAKSWQTGEYSRERTVVEINWRLGTIEVYKVHHTELTSVPTRVYNGHATRLVVAPGTRKADIIECIEHYAEQIIDAMATYDASIHVGLLADFGENNDAKGWAMQ
jgi:hypothetical protein